jgi:OmpA-OmpF porin, OOP family
MRRIIGIHLLVFVANFCFAQNKNSDIFPERTETTWFSDTVHVLERQSEWGISLGGLRYNGDISNDNSFVVDHLSPGAALYLKRYIIPNLAWRANLFYSKFKDTDLHYTTPTAWRGERQFYFDANLAVLNLRAEWDIFGKLRFRHRDTVLYKLDRYTEYAITEKLRRIPAPYLFAGAGLAGFKAETAYNYNESLSGLASAVAQDMANNKNFHTKFCWTVGGGFNIDLSKKVVLGLELGTNFANSDYLDGISISGNPKKPDWWWYGALNLGFRFGKKDKDADGVLDKNDKCPTIPGSAKTTGCPDADKDGIPDWLDSCPHLPGIRALAGCPIKDADEDGIADVDDKCPTVPGLAQFQGCPDIDGDGIEDSQDSCKTVPGIAQFNGCPDTDGDGIEDSKDACPKEAGPAEYYYGCPVRDTDGDSIEDKLDACLLIAGKPEFKGCPDTDGDGVEDRLDICPALAGALENKGCPVIEKKDREKLSLAVKAVKFETGKATLKAESSKILSDIADILNRYPYYNLKIDGHTDSQGKDESNMALSQARAQSCADFLTAKGIAKERFIVKGHGETMPIGDNKTAAGRTLNRRVEFDLELDSKQ